MKISSNSNSIMQGSFSSNQKMNKVSKEDDKNKNSLNGNIGNSYTKMIENIEEQMKKLQESDAYDEETKKAKLKELQKQIEDIRKMEQEEKTGKLGKDEKAKEEKSKNENIDGDKLTLSEDMEKMLKDDVALDKLKAKNAVHKEMKGEARVLQSEIDIDKGMGRNTERKEDRVSEISDKIEAMNNNELEKNTGQVGKDDKKNKRDIKDSENLEEVKNDTSAIETKNVTKE